MAKLRDTKDKSAWTTVEIHPRELVEAALHQRSIFSREPDSFTLSWPRACICCARPMDPNHPFSFSINFKMGSSRVVRTIKTTIPYCSNCWTHMQEPPYWNLGCLPTFLVTVLSFVVIIMLIGFVNADAVQNQAWPFIVAFCAAGISLFLSAYLWYEPRRKKAEARFKALLTQQCSSEGLAVHLTTSSGPYFTTSYLVSFANHEYAELFRQANAWPSVSTVARVPLASTQVGVPNPTDAESHNRRGNTLLHSKRYEKALAAFDQAIKLAPTNALYHHNRCVALFALKRYEEAVAAYDQALKSAPTNALYHHNRGVALHALKRYEEALAAYDQAIYLDPTNAAYRSHQEAALREWPSAAKPPQPSTAPEATAAKASSPQVPQAATTPAGFQTFTSSDNSFSITCPSDWQQTDAPSGTGLRFTSQDQQEVFIVTALKSGTSQADPATVASAACSSAGGTPSSPQTVSISGLSWTKVECDTSDGSTHLVAEAVLYKGNLFLIVYDSPRTSFESNASQFFTPMEQSFQFLRSREPGTGAWPSPGAGFIDLRSDEEREMAERSQSEHERIAHSLGVADLTRELISLVGEDNSGFANRTRIREIGEELYRRGGHRLMQEAYYHVRSTNIYFSQDIWDRIGEWQA